MNLTAQFEVNGREQRVSTDAKRTLLDVLREDLGLTGTKFGCGEGQCRACTVLIDGKAVQACQTTMDEVDGRKIETIEGLANAGKLHPVQEAFIAEGAMQCGYCVPGMVMATVGLFRRNPKPTAAEITAGLNGNLCRCCGYVNVLKAVQRAAQIRKEGR
ncbi:MAG: (2Fe-2S)-binding protein [Pedosphaera sp.]|nr:(2Fe-2S)-binding protein [Pedosphaera sp.]